MTVKFVKSLFLKGGCGEQKALWEHKDRERAEIWAQDNILVKPKKGEQIKISYYVSPGLCDIFTTLWVLRNGFMYWFGFPMV